MDSFYSSVLRRRHKGDHCGSGLLVSFQARIVHRNARSAFYLFDVAWFAVLTDTQGQERLNLSTFFTRAGSLLDFPFRQGGGGVVVTISLRRRCDQKPASIRSGTRTWDNRGRRKHFDGSLFLGGGQVVGRAHRCIGHLELPFSDEGDPLQEVALAFLA